MSEPGSTPESPSEKSSSASASHGSSPSARGSWITSITTLCLAASVIYPVGYKVLPHQLMTLSATLACSCDTWKAVALAVAPMLVSLLVLGLVVAPVPTMDLARGVLAAAPWRKKE